MSPTERLNAPISDAELDRRHAAVRTAMERAGIDVLVMQNNNDHVGGYVRWFIDTPAVQGAPITVVFPRDDFMTIVRHGPSGADIITPDGSHPAQRRIRHVRMAPSFPPAWFTARLENDQIIEALRPYAGKAIGMVGSFQFGYAAGAAIHAAFPDADITEQSDLVDRIKAIKSAEEQQLCRDCAALQDGAMAAAFAAIRPGMRDREIAATAQKYAHDHGAEMGIYLCASWTPGAPAPFTNWHNQARIVRPGDVVSLLVECNAPGGMYCELGRNAVVGRASQQMLDDHELVRQARQFTLDRLVPGVPVAEIWDQYNGFLRSLGRPEEKRLFCHGQGTDLVERPLVRYDDDMTVQAGMNIVVHPTWIAGGLTSWLCDNYLIGPNGPGPRLHAYPEAIIEVAA